MRSLPNPLTRAASHGTSRASVASATGQALQIGVLLWPSFPLMSFSGIVESLRHAGDHGDNSSPRYARWDVIGAPGSAARSSCGVPVATTTGYIAPSNFDHVFVIGGLLRDLDSAAQGHLAYLRRVHQARIPLCGVCTGSFVLARAGLLAGRPVCIHPYHKEHFEASFPGTRFVANRDFVTERGVTTVLGGVSILPLMKGLIAAHLGPDRAAKVEHQMTLPSSDAGVYTRAPASGAPRRAEIRDPRIQRALVILDAQSTQTPQIAALARSLGLSERHFLRLFRIHVGTSPKDYMIETKLRAAVWMLQNTTRSITSIAYATGFSSGAALADHCRHRLNATPGAIRKMEPTD